MVVDSVVVLSVINCSVLNMWLSLVSVVCEVLG